MSATAGTIGSTLIRCTGLHLLPVYRCETLEKSKAFHANAPKPCFNEDRLALRNPTDGLRSPDQKSRKRGVVSAAKRAEQLELGEDLASVISHETTVKVLVYLVDRPGSPTEIGEALGIPTAKASHHAKKLTKLGLAELVEEQEVRGSIKHIYRAVVRPIFETEDWARLSLSERHRYSVWVIRMILADAAQSLNAEVFDEYPTRHLSRVPLLVDGEGLDEVAEIQKRALEEIMEVGAISAERRMQTGDAGMHMLAAMMCFPLPGPSEGVGLEARKKFT